MQHHGVSILACENRPNEAEQTVFDGGKYVKPSRDSSLLFSSSLTVYTGPDFYVRFSSEMFKLVWYFDYFLCSNISLWEKVN